MSFQPEWRPKTPKQARQAPEGLLLFLLVVALLLTVASYVFTRRPAAEVFEPINASSDEAMH